MTLNITKSNPLNFMYNQWLHFGGEPKTPEDLCHFMRVCMFWWWMRWFWSPEYYKKTPADHYHLNGKGRFPRALIFLGEILLIVLVITLINEGKLLTGLLFIVVGIAGFITVVLLSAGAVDVSKKVKKNEMFETFRAYLSARKQRICPFIEVEK